MPPAVRLSRQVPEGIDAVVVPVTTEAAAAPASGDDEGALADVPARYAAAQGFEGKADQVLVVPADGEGPDTVLVGVGPAADVDPTALRRAAGAAVRAAGERRTLAVRLLDAVTETPARPVAAQAIAEGAALATYRFDRFKREPRPSTVEEVVVVGAGGKRVEGALAVGMRVAEGVAFARDLVNTPGGDLTPRVLAEAAIEVAERENLQITVLDEDAIAEARLGGLLGVNRGSTQPPRFIEICYEPPSPRGSMAWVGKGITFDSGGLSLKTAEGMMAMKNDMGGAAAVLGAFSALPAVAPRCRVRGYLPATDNMGGGDATRPGDVLETRNGTTVEVLNTDAEGRLVLADALALAVEAEPDAIVDLATLTGAVEVALGSRIAGLMGNHEAWVDQVRAAADRAGERVWPLPLPTDYKPWIESDVADLRNIGKVKGAGTIVAGLFLQEFVGKGVAWAHLDIAGTAWWADSDQGFTSKGGTGWGVRTLLELAKRFRRPR
jgi:leucyl aminopeptidase